MQKWQENRNYRRIKGENGNIIANIITIDGKDEEVTEEVFLAYSQSDRRERYIIEEVEPGKLLSLEKLQEDGVPLEKLGAEMVCSAEDSLLEQETLSETERQKVLLRAALATLEEDERLLIEALFFERKSVREYAAELDVYHRTIICRRDKLLRKLYPKIFL